MLLVVATSFGKTSDNINLNIVFVGNSITYGAGLENPTREAPPVKAAIYLTGQPFIGSVKYSNQGVSGSTTVDFLPETNTLFPKVKAAADKFKDEDWATLVFSIMLGTNDSAIRGTNGCPVSPEQGKGLCLEGFLRNMTIMRSPSRPPQEDPERERRTAGNIFSKRGKNLKK